MILSFNSIYDYIDDGVIYLAGPFDEWVSNYSERGMWSIRDVEKNAYHIQYLANIMSLKGSWIGEPIYLPTLVDHVHNGQHRLRAVSYLKSRFAINIEVVYEFDKSAYLCKKPLKECWESYLIPPI